MEREFSEKNMISKKLLQFLIGTVTGILTAVIIALFLSFIMTLSFVPDNMVKTASTAVSVIASFACGFTTVKLIGSGGLLYGALSGLMLFAVQLIMSLIFSSPCLLTDVLIAFLISTAISAVGGITAVNTGK